MRNDAVQRLWSSIWPPPPPRLKRRCVQKRRPSHYYHFHLLLLRCPQKPHQEQERSFSNNPSISAKEKSRIRKNLLTSVLKVIASDKEQEQAYDHHKGTIVTMVSESEKFFSYWCTIFGCCCSNPATEIPSTFFFLLQPNFTARTVLERRHMFPMFWRGKKCHKSCLQEKVFLDNASFKTQQQNGVG